MNDLEKELRSLEPSPPSRKFQARLEQALGEPGNLAVKRTPTQSPEDEVAPSSFIAWLIPLAVAAAVAVDVHRVGQAARVATRRRVVAVVAFLQAPTVVLTAVRASSDPVDLLHGVLADVADPEVAGRVVEGHAPGVPEPVGPDLREAARDEGRAGAGVGVPDPDGRASLLRNNPTTTNRLSAARPMNSRFRLFIPAYQPSYLSTTVTTPSPSYQWG